MKKNLRVIFFGTPDFAVPSLEALVANDINIVSVVTRPDRPKGRGRRLAAPPVKKTAESLGVAVLQPDKIRGEDFIAKMKALEPDLFAVAAYGRILPGTLLHVPRFGTINVHPSLLPKYRGAAPIQWTLIRGETETGVTIIQMDEGEDTGDILISEKISIRTHESSSGAMETVETAGTLSVKLSELGGRLLLQTIDLIREKKLKPRKQDENIATHAPILEKKDGEIDWTKPAYDIGCLIRGLDPWPTAHTTLAEKKFKLFNPLVIPEQVMKQTPGELCRADTDGLLIATGKDYLLIREVQREGSKRMEVGPFLRGCRLETGLKFG
ncbi:MAG: methionyl-tRNA formyltransferase [Thermodesulfobacteriota bacterium]|nr:methionyl-tRNA formyltransferase [Thermodesulfobacteriota bacterium]